MFGKTKVLVNSWFTKQLKISKRTGKTEQPTVNSLNFVVDSLLHALQVVRYSWSLHGVAWSLWDMACHIPCQTFDTFELLFWFQTLCFR